MPSRTVVAIRRALLTAAVLLAACGSDGNGGGGSTGDRSVTVVTHNLYIGSNVEALASPAALANPAAAVSKFYADVVASDPPGRMKRIAAEIAAANPDLVGLQEVARYATKPLLATAETVTYDFAQLVVDELRAAGRGYHVVDGAVSQNFDNPNLLDSSGTFIHFTDRDVVLARDGMATRDAANGRFTTLLGVSIAGFQVTIPRGWAAVTADVNGATVRFMNTHLEAVTEPTGVREAQARELAAVAAASTLPTILVGDLNSPPAEATGAYGILHGAGLADAWDALHPTDPGLTCCWDATLTSGAFTSRIDVVLFRGTFTALAADVVGETAAERTPSGLAPSDHAGVVGRLQLR